MTEADSDITPHQTTVAHAPPPHAKKKEATVLFPSTFPINSVSSFVYLLVQKGCVCGALRIAECSSSNYRAGRKAAHPSKTAEESALLVNADVRIDHLSDHIGVMSHSSLKNIHSGRDSMRRTAEYDSTANAKSCTQAAKQPPNNQPSATGRFLFSAFFLPAILSSQIGVNMSVTFDTVGGSQGAHVCTFHTSSHTVLGHFHTKRELLVEFHFLNSALRLHLETVFTSLLFNI